MGNSGARVIQSKALRPHAKGPNKSWSLPPCTSCVSVQPLNHAPPTPESYPQSHLSEGKPDMEVQRLSKGQRAVSVLGLYSPPRAVGSKP